MTRTAAATLAVLLLTTASAARAQGAAGALIDGTTPIFCRDNTGVPVLQTYANLGGVMRRYGERFHFDMTVQPGNPTTLVFSKPDETPYSITYTVEPYRDDAGRSGVLLDKMHIFLENADRDVQGVAMCYFTEYGK